MRVLQAGLLLLRFADIAFFLNKLKVGGNPASSKSIGAIFPTAFAPFMSLCHILVILAIFQILHQQEDNDLLRLRWSLAFFNKKVFFNYGMYIYL